MGLMEGLGKIRRWCSWRIVWVGLLFPRAKAMEILHGKVHMAILVTALMPDPTFSFTLLSQGLVMVRWQALQLDLKLVFGWR
ncbi:hypothetical protein V5N11_028141 [Cardamine amara subsp. amara]|uniref:Uncharacterized protein n=1 Tax=Cardamine amara subsp. amara TaxID=228776 RepID=A0ABD0ZC56_CARAN